MIDDTMENIVEIGSWLPAFSPSPSMFSKAIGFRVVKAQVCVVKS